MKRELVFINIVLAVALIAAAFEFQAGWLDFEATHDVQQIQFTGDPLGVPAPADGQPGAIQDWTSIVDQNLFSFDRNDLAIETSNGIVPAGPRPYLFGTMSLGDEPMAMMAIGDPGNREYKPVRVGEVVDGWELIEILGKSVRVRSGGVEATIIMNDPTAGMPRNRSRTMARSGAAPPVSTVRAPASVPSVQSGVNRTITRQSGIPSYTGTFSEGNVPEGFIIQRTPFGNRLIPKPQL